jgi:hypothetical protein
MLLQLTPAAGNDERAGYPSASEYGRLVKCRASFLMTKKAQALGQVAHERSPASDLGTKLHLQFTDIKDKKKKRCSSASRFNFENWLNS